MAVSSSSFLISDSLYLAPQRAYLGLIHSITYEPYPVYATLLYLLHVHEPALAANLISHLVEEPRTRALYTVALSLKQLQRLKAQHEEDRGVVNTYGQRRREQELMAIMRSLISRNGKIGNTAKEVVRRIL